MPEPIDVDVFRAYMNSLQERLDAAQTARLQILAASVRTGRILQSSFTVIIILLGIIAGALIFP
jgi:hypothetical protein